MTTGPSHVEPWELYERHAELWTDVRGREVSMEAAWLERFASHLPSHAAVLDLGYGHGAPVGAWLLERGFSVTGIDRSASLVQRATAAFPSGRWLMDDLRSFELGTRFAGLVAWHSLFHLTGDEQLAALPRLAAHAQPGAVLLFTTGAAAGVATGSFGDEALQHYSLSLATYEEVLGEVGGSILERRVQDPDCGGATVWLAAFGEAR
jgi:SAM-dependent methyltransferase